MVKIPSLDELKKMGTGLVDSAKNVNIGGVVDKFKTGIESVSGGGKAADGATSDDPLKDAVKSLSDNLAELQTMQAAQASLVKKIQSQLNEVVKVADQYEKPAPEPSEKKRGK